MKINVKIVCGKQERIFPVACGIGDKTFKWLGIVASQRFALEGPHGALRRFDELRGLTDRAQQPAYNITLPNGEYAYPGALISDYLRDNDEVTIDILKDLPVDNCGLPNQSKWSTMAFNSTVDIEQYNSESKGGEGNESESKPIITWETKKAKIEFMRIVLCSQMLNIAKLSHMLEVSWVHVKQNVPKLTTTQLEILRETFLTNFGVLLELFQKYSPDGRMNLRGYNEIMEDASVYPSRDFDKLARKDFKFAVSTCGGVDLHFGGFLHSILLAAQSIYVDCLESSGKVYDPVDATTLLLSTKIIGLAQRFRLPVLIRQTFCSDECLLKMRDFHDQLFLTFERYAVKSNRDHPTTLTIEIMSELLYDAQLIEEFSGPRATAKTAQLLAEVKLGVIVGRSKLDATDSSSISPPDENEFTFAEFVDASARAAVTRYSSGGKPYAVLEYILAGIKDVANAQHKPAPLKQAANKR